MTYPPCTSLDVTMPSLSLSASVEEEVVLPRQGTRDFVLHRAQEDKRYQRTENAPVHIFFPHFLKHLVDWWYLLTLWIESRSAWVSHTDTYSYAVMCGRNGWRIIKHPQLAYRRFVVIISKMFNMPKYQLQLHLLRKGIVTHLSLHTLIPCACGWVWAGCHISLRGAEGERGKRKEGTICWSTLTDAQEVYTYSPRSPYALAMVVPASR